MNQKQRNYLLIGISLLIFFSIFTIRLDEPFFGHFEGGQLWIASAFRSFNLFGLEATAFLPIRTEGPTNPVTGQYYLHHPPLIVWITAVGNWLFGYEQDTGRPFEMSQRLVAIFFTMLSLSLIFSLTKRLSKNAIVGLLAMIFYGFSPMIIYYSRTPYYDMLIMPFVLAYSYYFMRWMQGFTKNGAYLLMFLAVVIMWIDWVGAFYLSAIALVCFIYGTNEHRKYMLMIGIVTICATVLVPVFYEVLRPGNFASLMRKLDYRLSSEIQARTGDFLTVERFLLSTILDMIRIVPVGLTVMGIWGIVWYSKQANALNRAMLWALIVGPLAFWLVFRNAFYIHDWYEMHFMPALAVGAAWVAYFVWKIEPRGLQRFAKPLVLALVLCSIGITVYWSYFLHQKTLNPFARALVAELPLYTTEADRIAIRYSQPYYEVNFYAYRRVIWAADLALAGFAENDVRYAVLCFDSPEAMERYQGEFAIFPYVVLAEDCRLIDVLGESN